MFFCFNTIVLYLRNLKNMSYDGRCYFNFRRN